MPLFIFLVNVFFHPQPVSEILDGYTNKLSGFPGDSISIYLNAKSSGSFSLKLYDLSGKEVFECPLSVFPQEPARKNPSENGYGYKVSGRVVLPTVPSGVYLWDKTIPFVMKSRAATITVVYPSNTVNAYCSAGGKSLYDFNSSDKARAQKVSFLRPAPLQVHVEAFLKWMLDQRLPSVGYITDVDFEEYSAFRKSKLLIIPGHSEYWTFQSRRNFDRFVSDGKDVLILSGNTMWWQARYNRTKEQLICYRDAKTDPVKSTRLKTVTWADASLQYPIVHSTGTDFNSGGYGLKDDQGWNGYRIVSRSPLLEGTGLKIGDILKCPSDELDGAPVTLSANGTPSLNYPIMTFSRAEIVGYDLVSRGSKQGVATWIVVKPRKDSGVIINTASTDWCSYRGIGAEESIRTITSTMIRKLLNGENVFSAEKDLVQ